MKIKPTRKRGRVLVELGPNEPSLPATLFQLKRVLVPVDFSDCSKKALQYAVPFAKQFDAELVLVYVVQPYLPVPEMTSVDAELILNRMKESGRVELAKLRADIPGDVRAQTELRVGRPHIEIVKAADEADADLNLLSTHGNTGLKRLFLGSVTEHVIRYAHCPVLTVREREHDFVNAPAKTSRTRSSSRLRPASVP
jgi:nucleotide-binding universal stress UspA family protein